MDAVQRLDGSGYVKINQIMIKNIFTCLRYSLAPTGNFRVLAFSKLYIEDTLTLLSKLSNFPSTELPTSVRELLLLSPETVI